MASGKQPHQSPPDPSKEVSGKLDILAAKIEALQTAISAVQSTVGEVKTTVGEFKKGRFWSTFGPVVIAGGVSVLVASIAAWATLTAAQKSFDSAIAAAQKNLDNAAKNAFEAARGANSLQDYKTGQELIARIENEFAESAVQRSVKKDLGVDLHALKLLADRLKVQSITELSDYAGQLLGAYATKAKHWEDYEQQERHNIEQRCDDASKALDLWARTSP